MTGVTQFALARPYRLGETLTGQQTFVQSAQTGHDFAIEGDALPNGYGDH